MSKGSVSHAEELAAYLDEVRHADGAELSVTDAGLCVEALRAYAKARRPRGLAILAVAAPMLLIPLLSFADTNRDGRVDLADFVGGPAAAEVASAVRTSPM